MNKTWQRYGFSVFALSGLLRGLDTFANAFSRTLTPSWLYLTGFVESVLLPWKPTVGRVKWCYFVSLNSIDNWCCVSFFLKYTFSIYSNLFWLHSHNIHNIHFIWIACKMKKYGPFLILNHTCKRNAKTKIQTALLRLVFTDFSSTAQS